MTEKQREINDARWARINKTKLRCQIIGTILVILTVTFIIIYETMK